MPDVESSRPRAIGADRIEKSNGQQIVLLCPVSKGWDARIARTTVRSAHPGTTVAWEDRLYEVRGVEPLADGATRYRIATWEEGHAIRRLERYDEESERAREADRADLASGIRRRRWSILLAPLAGLLPGAVQKKMEHEFGAPSLAMTITSAVPLFVIGFLGMFRYLLAVVGGGHGIDAVGDWPGWLAPDFPIALYLMAESALRLGSAIAQGEPMGSLPVVLGHAVYVAARKPRSG
jgi:hypothetical protein